MPVPISHVHYAPQDPQVPKGKADYIPDQNAPYHYEYTNEIFNVIQRFKKSRDGRKLLLVEQLLPSDVKPPRPIALSTKDRLKGAILDAQKDGADVSEYEPNIDPKEDIGEPETNYGSISCEACGMLFDKKKDMDGHECKPVERKETEEFVEV